MSPSSISFGLPSLARSPRLRLVGLSLLGGVLIHVALVACSGGTTVSGGGFQGERDAHAQNAPAATPCTNWEVKAFVGQKFSNAAFSYVDPDGTPQSITIRVMDTTKLPPGWEPFSGEAAYSVLARHCAD